MSDTKVINAQQQDIPRFLVLFTNILEQSQIRCFSYSQGLVYSDLVSLGRLETVTQSQAGSRRFIWATIRIHSELEGMWKEADAVYLQLLFGTLR
jgi:hypothetical protein